MEILDYLRPRWRRSDPDVRAAAVREMGPREQARLEAIAQSDPNARVRRIALKKLEDPECLDRLAEGETDQDLRAFAAERARELRVVLASSDGALAECEAALARLADERSLAAIASSAAHETIRHAALARTTGDRVLRDVVRSATDPMIRRAALARIEDPAILRSIAVADGHADLALQALERLTDPAVLRAVAESRTAPKSVRQRARALLGASAGERPPIGPKEGHARQFELCLAVESLIGTRDLLAAAAQVRTIQQEWAGIARDVEPREDVAGRFHKACERILDEAGSLARRQDEVDTRRRTLQENLAARASLCERVERLDDTAAPDAVDEATAEWRRLPPLPDDELAPLARRFRLACEKAAARRQQRGAREVLEAKLEALVVEAEALAAALPVPTARTWEALEKRWAAVASGAEIPGIGALRRRLESAGEELARRQQEADAAQRENVTRLEALCTRLHGLANAEPFDLKLARRELQTAEVALGDLGPLPPSEGRAAWAKRLSESRDELLRRFREAQEAEEWRRWANVAAQEELIRRAEALLAANDPGEATRELGRLQEEWAAVASAPPDKAQALWERFRSARDELRARSEAYLAENLAKKRALCAQVAALAESTAWNETAEHIKRLQGEWKEIGPVAPRHAQAVWQEFRAPCDAFFSRRKAYFASRDAERRTAETAKTSLCEQAEALADSTEWDATAAVMKRLQAEWKASGPLPRAHGDALWQRFRTACDRFFERRSRRHEMAEEALRQQAEAICQQLEALAATLAGEEPPPHEQTGKVLDDSWAAWLGLGNATLDDALADRLQVVCQRIAAAQPDALRGTRLDPAATRTRRERLCVRLEKLADTAPEPLPELSLQEQALALRERLASNTIGGQDSGAPRDAAPEVERISASWALLGPVLDDDARTLAERFARARERALAK